MPEIITTPHALVQTTNGKRFYVYSGEVSVPNSPTNMISIDNIGERDILFIFEIGCKDGSAEDFDLIVKINGIIVLTGYVSDTRQYFNSDNYGIKIIVPANTSLDILMTSMNATMTWTCAGHGKYI